MHKAAAIATKMHQLVDGDVVGILHTMLYLSHYGHLQAFRAEILAVLQETRFVTGNPAAARVLEHRKKIMDICLPLQGSMKERLRNLWKRRVLEERSGIRPSYSSV